MSVSTLKLGGRVYRVISPTPMAAIDEFLTNVSRPNAFTFKLVDYRVIQIQNRLDALYSEIDLVQLEARSVPQTRSTQGYYTALLTQLRSTAELHLMELQRIQE